MVLGRMISKVPWYVSTVAVLATAAVLALLVNVLIGPYFERVYLNEADPLAASALEKGAEPSGGAGGQAAPGGAQSGEPRPDATRTQESGVAATTPATKAAGNPTAQPTATTAPASPAAPTATPTAAGPKVGVLAQGQFRDGEPGHNGKGVAKLLRDASGALVLRFENFSVTNGPDIFVILSTERDASNAAASAGLDLGRVRATDGNVNYAVPAGTDPSKYRSVIIWCRSFKVVFASASLEATP
jgi:hypothetical protein